MLQLLFPDQEPELCADGIALDGGGAFLLGTRLVNPDELATAAAEPRPANPGLTTFVPLRPPVLGWPHLLNYLSMQPPESLDKAVFFLPPSVVGVRSLSGLGRDADNLGLPVQFPAGQLAEEPPGGDPGAGRADDVVVAGLLRGDVGDLHLLVGVEQVLDHDHRVVPLLDRLAVEEGGEPRQGLGVVVDRRADVLLLGGELVRDLLVEGGGEGLLGHRVAPLMCCRLWRGG